MASHTPGDSGPSVALTPRLKLHFGNQWNGSAQVAPPEAAVLGDDGDALDATANLSVFGAAEPAIELNVQMPTDAVLGDEQAQPAVLEYQPDESAVYALVQAIQTADGIIYDFTLPQIDDTGGGLVLGPDGGSGALRFPVNSLGVENGPTPDSQDAVLGIEDFVGSAIGGVVGGVVLKRVLQVIKTPFEKSLIDTIRKTESEAWAGALRNNQFQPFQGFESWRTLLPPGGERRVLLFVHGFASSLKGDYDNEWLHNLGQRYDAVLGYNHPTIWCDPEHNARELLQMIPDDLRLSVDVIARSRGGLVARSLVELVEPTEQFSVRRVITNGTPHAGTHLADPERWDRLVSIGMTAASWLASAAGATVWIPKVIELVLKAAAQFAFDLPGIGAMTPEGAFIQKLNTGAETGSGIARAQGNVQYATISSRFSVFGVAQPAFQQVFNAFAAQASFDAPNDLVVPTESMTSIDQRTLVPPERQLLTGIDHFSYFREAHVVEFMRRMLSE